jgi:hypothetical protein
MLEAAGEAGLVVATDGVGWIAMDGAGLLVAADGAVGL